MPDDTVQVAIVWSKTNQFGERNFVIPLCPVPGSPLCPVTALKRMFRMLPASPSSPAFIFPVGHTTLSLTHRSFVSYLRFFLRKAGHDPNLYSGHSFRKGGCTFAHMCNVSPDLLRIHGDWRSAAYQRYLSLPVTHRQRVSQAMASGIRDPSLLS